MDLPTFTCQFCAEHQEWDTAPAADSAAVWHLFQAHPLRWMAIAGSNYPADPPPQNLGHLRLAS